MSLTMGSLYSLARTAGYEGHNRERVLRHLATMAEALWPTGHLDQIAQECAAAYDDGEDAAVAEHEADEARREAEAEAAGWAERERQAEADYHRLGMHRDEPF
jgi:hypothetical protein